MECKKCGKILKSKSGYSYHIKKVCPPNIDEKEEKNEIKENSESFNFLQSRAEAKNQSFNQLIKINYLYEFPYYHKYEHLEFSNKIIVPQNILYELTKFDNVQYPIIFNLTIKKLGLTFKCGVHEFVEGIDELYCPYRILNSFNVESCAIIDLSYDFNKSYVQGTLCTLQFHDYNFFENNKDYKQILERKLKHNYVFLQEDSVISINYKNKDYLINIIKCEPQKTILINNTDLKIEFKEPLNYSEIKKKRDEENKRIKEKKKFEQEQKLLEVKYAEFYKRNKYIPFSHPEKARRLGSK